MPPRLFPYAFLLLYFGFISTSAIQDFRYYPDTLSELSPEKLTLKHLGRLVQPRSQNARFGSLPVPRLEDFRGKEQERLEFDRQALDALVKKSNIIHALPKLRQKYVPNYPPSQLRQNAFEEDPVLREYPGRNPSQFYFHPYSRGVATLSDPEPQHHDREYPTVAVHRSRHQEIREHGMKEEPLMDFFNNYRSPNRQNAEHYSEGVADDGEKNLEEFTFRFDDKLKDVEFADNPSQSGYYDTEDPVTAPEAGSDPKGDERREEDLPKTVSEGGGESDYTEETMTSKLIDRRADSQSPSVKAVEHKITDDIYFVAVVAGCSAAAMFILVLISLTWCRLQRGAKAAADVEYPAYGVTGPNKDTSPSGDRRLAQSAQMYHYQHQKQQIIAMESRTATARDPGSVSEAESDEENEEGDYTVYECPGLAPTGEMEVKNPLFHDDPTPATPATGQGHNKRSSEDHM